MTSTAKTPAPDAAALPADLQDERLIASQGIGGFVRVFLTRLRGGDLGPLPVVIGLIVIWAVFQAQNDAFLSSRNLVNLTLQCAATGTIALGIVLVLMLGEIDLSVGSVSGLAAAILAVGAVSQGWLAAAGAAGALAAGRGDRVALRDAVHPVRGTQLRHHPGRAAGGARPADQGARAEGSINIPSTPRWWSSPSRPSCRRPSRTCSWCSWSPRTSGPGWSRTAGGRAAGLSTTPIGLLGVRGALLLVVLAIPVALLDQDRGVSVMFLLFLALVVAVDLLIRRTRWGRSVVAIGGNVEAARRAGINVRRVYISVFVMCSTLAALGGILAASRLAASNQSSGGGDTNLNAIAAAVIGGTSLFGGRGSAYSALLGILVIQSISNGLSLINLGTPARYMITGGVLLLAVVVDSLSRRSRASHGRA